jgi:hypothetical protein
MPEKAAGRFSSPHLSKLSNMFNSSSTNFSFTFEEWNEWRVDDGFLCRTKGKKGLHREMLETK